MEGSHFADTSGDSSSSSEHYCSRKRCRFRVAVVQQWLRRKHAIVSRPCCNAYRYWLTVSSFFGLYLPLVIMLPIVAILHYNESSYRVPRTIRRVMLEEDAFTCVEIILFSVWNMTEYFTILM